jgi:hypothetical protein
MAIVRNRPMMPPVMSGVGEETLAFAGLHDHAVDKDSAWDSRVEVDLWHRKAERSETRKRGRRELVQRRITVSSTRRISRSCTTWDTCTGMMLPPSASSLTT